MKIALILPKSGFALLAVLLMGSFAGVTYSQVQFPVELPTPKVGDVAKYRTIDLWTNKEQSTTQSELVEIKPDRLMSRVTSSTASQVNTVSHNREWQPCRSMEGSEQIVCTGSLKFPMKLGNKYSYEKLPYSNGKGWYQASCEVKAEESVMVPAGTFDTVRIECPGYWTNSGFGNGSMKEIVWYAPKISRYVKLESRNFDASSKPVQMIQIELVEFVAGR